MTMYLSDFLPLMLVVIYQHLVGLLFLYSVEVIKELEGFSATLFQGL